MSCPMCGKRPAKRFCPAKGEKICALCCGQQREVTIDCPEDCPHLITAHRYEGEHRKPLSPQDFPYPDVQVRPDFVDKRWPAIVRLVTFILRFQLENADLNDSAASAAIQALAATYRTLGAGIYYKRPPDAPLPRALYGQMEQFLEELRANGSARAGFPELRDSDIFQLLVFLSRIAKQETNGRPLSRTFLGFLRERFPLPDEEAKEPSRIIIP